MSRMIALDLASKRKRRREDYVYHLDYRTRWSDNDMFHHLNNPVYGVLIDSIINAYLIEHCEYNIATSPRIGLVANTYCDYFGASEYPNKMDVGLRVVKLGKSSVMYECGVFEQGKEEVKAVGGFIQIWVKREDFRPASEGIPQEVRKGLEKLLNDKEGGNRTAKL